MHHTAAYTSTVTLAANTEYDMTALSDAALVIQNGHFLPQFVMQLIYAFPVGATETKARISSPTLAVITPPFLRDINAGAAIQIPPRVADYSNDPLTLAPLEELTWFNTHSAATAEQDYGIIGLMVQSTPQPQGNVYTIRGTAAGTLVANAWTNVSTITWFNQLPTGLYACVGGEAQSAGAIAFRFIFERQVWRPGGHAIQVIGSPSWYPQRFGGLGVWGTFHNYAMPQCEMLSVSADVSEEIYMDLMKIG